MGIIGFGRPNDEMSIEDLVDLIARTNKTVEHLVNGRIDSQNVFEVGGWRVTLDKLASKDGDVGMSTTDTVGDDIRFWAGDAVDGTPKFKVTKGGILTAIAALFASSTGYPRVEMNSATGSIGAYQAADNYLEISPDAYVSTPGITMHSPTDTALMFLSSVAESLMILTAAGDTSIQISSGKNLDLFCESGYKTRFDSWSAMYSLFEGKTLRQELDTLITQGNTNSVNISTLFSDVSNLYSYFDYLDSYCSSLDARLTAIGG